MDDGPFKNNAYYVGDVEFKHENMSCENTAVVKTSGEIYFNGSTFKNKPVYGITIALWLYADSTLNRQDLFSTRSSTSPTGRSHYSYIIIFICAFE